jgi:hypothetical protein
MRMTENGTSPCSAPTNSCACSVLGSSSNEMGLPITHSPYRATFAFGMHECCASKTEPRGDYSGRTYANAVALEDAENKVLINPSFPGAPGVLPHRRRIVEHHRTMEP